MAWQYRNGDFATCKLNTTFSALNVALQPSNTIQTVITQLASSVHHKVAVFRPAKRYVSHLLLAGHNPLSPPTSYSARSRQSPNNPSLVQVPFSDWLGTVGRAKDVEAGYSIIPGGLSGSSHHLISYRSDGTDRCFAVGRNEMGQLGLGFNSQESTRGLVEGFEGDGISGVNASVQSTYMILREGESSSLFVSGSLHRGRSGQRSFFTLGPEDEQAELQMLSKATKVELPSAISGIKQIATGFEHVLLLSKEGEIWGSGCNTDGQLGLGKNVVHDVYKFTKMELPKEVAGEGGVSHISASADTSALLTASGRVWTWGNSEYGQAFHGKPIDQIHTATEIDTSFLPSSRRLVEFRCGGSFSIALDNRGSVYSAGFGALGLGRDRLQSLSVTKIPVLEGQGITRIRAGWGWASAVRDDGASSAIYTWGVNNLSGRLGVGSTTARGSAPVTVYEPTRLQLPLRELGLHSESAGPWNIGEVECTEDALWVALNEEV